MRGPECHPWAENIFDGSVRVAKISRSHRLALAPPGVARRSPPTRIGRPEVNLNSFCQARPQAVPIGAEPKATQVRGSSRAA